MDRETLGREVRRVWIEFCREIGDDKPSHLASWEDMTEPEREVDRRIGEAIARMALTEEVERLRLIEERMVLTWRTNDGIRKIARKENLDPYGVHLTALTRCNIIANCLGYEPEAE